MAIKWTEEMKEELKNTKNLKTFADKYGMSRESARNKKKELLRLIEEVENDSKSEEVKIEKEVKLKNILEEVNASNISIVPSIILNIDSLIDKGVKFYLVDVVANISALDKSISDIEHVLENSYKTLDNETLAILAKNIGILRSKRRLYKNEYSFLDNNRVNCDYFIKFIKDVESYSQRACDKLYSTKVLKEELGKVHITNVNNSELLKLREKVFQLEKEAKLLNTSSNIDVYKERLLALEKFRVKQDRKNKRDKREIVAVDNLSSNWKVLFEKLDSTTRKEMLDDCYSLLGDLYKDNSEVADYIVWNETLPQYLYDKKYFLKSK